MAECYLFHSGDETFYFTPSIFAKTLGADTYLPTVVSRAELNLSENLVKSQMVFTFPNTNVFAKRCLEQLTDGMVLVKIFKETSLFWIGRVVSANLKEGAIIVTCDSGYNTLLRQAAGPRFSEICWKSVYDINCGVNPAAYTNTYPAYTLSGIYITVALSEPDNHYVGGLAIIGSQTRRITTNSSAGLEISDPFLAPVTGDLLLRRGCRLTRSDCLAFGNIINFGGFSHIPTINPMSQAGLL